MYIDSIKIQKFRTFRNTQINFIHQDCDFESLEMPRPRISNINLVLGINGLGKTTLLKAIALAALGPSVSDSGIFPYCLIRREPDTYTKSPQPDQACIKATFTPHTQDQTPSQFKHIESEVTVLRRGDLESLRWTHPEEKGWHPIFSATSDAFFFVGYGASRRVEKAERVDLGSRNGSAFIRAQRVQSLFEESHSLIPLNSWLPKLEVESPDRFKQVVTLIDRLIGANHYKFQGELEEGEYIFSRKGLRVPFPALSDGYRAFLGWIGDLLYHVCMTCPSGKRLVDNQGIVMVDEIDLHLHPEWQMKILGQLAKQLPKIQFIVTSHSPLLVGSLEWMNIMLMDPIKGQASRIQRLKQPVRGLDADQVLLTGYFGLKSTRTADQTRNLKALTLRARDGDPEAALALLQQMSQGREAL
ncbi:AAA family ATPase [Prochlorothrix hollandica]|uniref:AAA family ATPase n=1 Tax=Prochlorothrix hollandica TaxID=1223 RepID=UPI00034A8263|nr:AAA family ATPase [Prochlorothrix hollandica]